MKTVFSVNDFN